MEVLADKSNDRHNPTSRLVKHIAALLRLEGCLLRLVMKTQITGSVTRKLIFSEAY
jgi:hypothetical protein